MCVQATFSPQIKKKAYQTNETFLTNLEKKVKKKKKREIDGKGWGRG